MADANGNLAVHDAVEFVDLSNPNEETLWFGGNPKDCGN